VRVSSGAGAQEIVVRFRTEDGRDEEIRNLWAFLETETPGGLHGELRQAREDTGKSGMAVEIVYALLGGFAGGVAEELTKPLVEAVKSWWRLRRDTGRIPDEVVVECGGRELARVPGPETTEDELAGEA
jgi:hypothetical protein